MKKTEDAFQQLSANIEHGWIVEWTRLEATAMLERGKAMEIYDVVLTKGALLTGMLPIGAGRSGADPE